jgi:hypothetical protein
VTGQHSWCALTYLIDGQPAEAHLEAIRCEHCKRLRIWIDDRGMPYPPDPIDHLLVQHLPAEILRFVDEGHAISVLAPAGSAAYLRYALIQLLASWGYTYHTITENMRTFCERYDAALLHDAKLRTLYDDSHTQWTTAPPTPHEGRADTTPVAAGVINPADDRATPFGLLFLLTRLLRSKLSMDDPDALADP